MTNNKRRRKEIRAAAGLPDDNGKILGLSCEDPSAISENTISNALPLRAQDNFFYGASGGATSPSTEVNAESQSISSEVPRKHPRP